MQTVRYVVYEDDGAFVAQCLDVDIASEGDTEEEAVENLREALTLYGEDHPIPAAPTPRFVFGELELNA